MIDAVSRAASGGALPQAVKIVEVGPRDGLQNEKTPVSLGDKVELVQGLVASGLRAIELGSFVSPRWVPQMAETEKVVARIAGNGDLETPVLVPNLKGLDLAVEAGATTIAVFAATTEGFARANLNASRRESFDRFAEVAAVATSKGMRVRGYVSCAIHCPFEGWVDPFLTAELAAELGEIGCYEVSLCDTTGAGSPGRARSMVRATMQVMPVGRLGVHFHDTYGQALANTLASLELGVSTVDSSVSGLGGCPYSPGAAGNLATEDLVYMLEGMGIATGVDLDRLIATGARISSVLERRTESGTARAALSARPEPLITI